MAHCRKWRQVRWDDMTAWARGAGGRRSVLVIPPDAAASQPGRPRQRSQRVLSLISAGSVERLDGRRDGRRRYDLRMIVGGSAEVKAP